jgi:hypothetical protein
MGDWPETQDKDKSTNQTEWPTKESFPEREPVQKWRQLPQEAYKIFGLREITGGKYGPLIILTLQTIDGNRLRVWPQKEW